MLCAFDSLGRHPGSPATIPRFEIFRRLPLRRLEAGGLHRLRAGGHFVFPGLMQPHRKVPTRTNSKLDPGRGCQFGRLAITMMDTPNGGLKYCADARSSLKSPVSIELIKGVLISFSFRLL